MRKDLEFRAHDDQAPEQGPGVARFSNFDEASSFALLRCCNSGTTVNIDVVTRSRSAARAWGGESSEEIYDADPRASIHERIVVRAEALGRTR